MKHALVSLGGIEGVRVAVSDSLVFPTSGPVGEEKLTDGGGHDKLSLPLLNLWPL